MIIIGLTGSVGMGKTEISKYFKKKKIVVFDADEEIKKLYKKKTVMLAIGEYFPHIIENGIINKVLLADIVFNNKDKLKILEKILHTRLRHRLYSWIRKCVRERKKLVVLDIPLLFESNNLNKYDLIILASCPIEIQKRRVLKRKNWDSKRFINTLGQQMDDKKKRNMADIVIDTDR